MFPEGSMIGCYYTVTRETPEERFTAAQKYIKKFPGKPAMYNNIVYMYMSPKKDNDMAKNNFEKYLELYPDGCNPYDSMAEFYLTTGSKEKAEKYYKKLLKNILFLKCNKCTG